MVQSVRGANLFQGPNSSKKKNEPSSAVPILGFALFWTSVIKKKKNESRWNGWAVFAYLACKNKKGFPQIIAKDNEMFAAHST